MFICGSASFTDEDREINEGFNNSPRAKRSKRTTSFCKIIGRDSSNKNPYANRGLDKFYALLADLDNKKQKIYTQMGPEEISFVRFVYANDSDRVKPIVVKVKDHKKPERTLTAKNSFANPTAAAAVSPDQTTTSTSAPVDELLKEQKKKMKRYNLRCGASFRLDNLRRPVYYFAAIMVLILVFLAVFGRSFAILCTSIGWYLVPMVGSSSSSSSTSSSSSNSNEKRLKRKKEFVTKQSDKKISHVSSTGPSSPTSVVNGGHGRSS